jgi:threonine/homoserine/homoserine lactone efflux protein
MAVDSVLAFWIVALALIVVPGADWAFTLSASLRGGSLVPAVGGLVLGYTATTLVVAGGVGALVAASPAALTGLTVAGGGYLVWHGAMTVTRPAALVTGTVTGTGDRASGTDWGILARGVGVSGLNPKGLLIFLALLPQFTSRNGPWPVVIQIGALGLVFTGTCAAFYAGLGLVARTALRSRPTAARVVSRVSGIAMVIIGVILLADRLIH